MHMICAILCSVFTEYKSTVSNQMIDFSHEVLEISSGIEEMGAPVWTLALCLLLVWTTIFLVLSKGVASLGKVSVLRYYCQEQS